MARYAISSEGAASMKALAKRMFIAANDILDKSAVLQSAVSSLGGGLGIYEAEISAVIAQGRTALAENHDDIEGLARQILEKANDIESLLGIGLGGSPASGGNISSASGRVPSLAPDRKTPRDLPETQFGFAKDSDGNLVYDSPNETDEYLYKDQGSAYKNFAGTCGLCSCANILRLAGVNLSEKDMIDYAAAVGDPSSFTGKLCSVGYNDPGLNGGTSPNSRQQILEHFGISSGIFNVEYGKDGAVSDNTLNLIADQVSTGHGVILSVHSDMLWYDKETGDNDKHAVTVTSVKKSEKGDILGFYICDSANGGTKFYSAEKIKNSLSGAPMNITYSKIR